jgi:hypothetical protein
MLQSQTVEQVEADLAALKAAAERAGTTLACLFSCSDEFEAAVIKARRASGALAPRRHSVRAVIVTLLLAAIFLML